MTKTIKLSPGNVVADHKAIRESIADLSAAWAATEIKMAELLRTIIDPASENHVAFAIYFSPTSTDARFKIVDAAFCELIGESTIKDVEAFEALMEPWRTFMRRLGRAKDFRNAIAHGSVSSVARYKTNHARLIPPIFDFRRIMPFVRNRQLPGLGASDMKSGVQHLWTVNGYVELFSAIVRARHAKDSEALQKTFLAAKASLKTTAPQKGAQKKPERRNQPRLSSAARRKAALARLVKHKKT